MMYSFAVEAVVVYHVYCLIWDTAIDNEGLEYFREVCS